MANRYPNANSRTHDRRPGYTGALAHFNETNEDGRVLHPTNGWRTNSVKRSRASALADFIKAGRIPYKLDLCQRVLREGF